MNSKKMILGISMIFLSGCEMPSRTILNPPEYISVDGSGPEVEKNPIMASGVPSTLSSECISGRFGSVSMVGLKMICEPFVYQGQPVVGPFKASDFTEYCGNVPSLYLREGEQVRLMLVKASDSIPTKDYLKNVLKVDKAHMEGASLLIVQNMVQPKYFVSCDDRAALIFQRTTTIPDGPFKDRALKVAGKFNSFMKNQGIFQ